MKEFRNMKVYGMSGYKYQSTPTIMLKGQWLRELGFDEGTPITVKCEGGKLTITRADEVECSYVEVVEKPIMCVAEQKAEFSKGGAHV